MENKSEKNNDAENQIHSQENQPKSLERVLSSYASALLFTKCPTVSQLLFLSTPI